MSVVVDEPGDAYALGIDVGTSSVKIAVVRREEAAVQTAFHTEKNTDACLPFDSSVPEHHPEGDLQDAQKIFTALESCVNQIPESLARRISDIGICGQMHGVVFWSSKSPESVLSHLITWQDRRCSAGFLSALPPSSPYPLSTGYGCATTAWLARNGPDGFLDSFDRAGNVMDFVAFMLCGTDSSEVSMSGHLAAAWGYYDPDKNAFDAAGMAAAGIPAKLIPKRVARIGEKIGVLRRKFGSLREKGNVSVFASMGDLQCFVKASLSDCPALNAACLNISTSAQVVFVTEQGFKFKEGDGAGAKRAIEYLPFDDDRMLATAASLNGGNVLAALIRTLQSWIRDLTGSDVDEYFIWKRINELSTANDSDDSGVAGCSVATARPFGERHDQRSVFAVESLSLAANGHLPLGCVFSTFLPILYVNQ